MNIRKLSRPKLQICKQNKHLEIFAAKIELKYTQELLYKCSSVHGR